MKILSVLCLLLCVCFVGGCGKEGPAGPQGPQGPQGPAGPPGTAVNFWYSPLAAIAGGPAGPPSTVTVGPHCCPSTALKITSNQVVADNDLQWVEFLLAVPDVTIKGVKIYYQVKTGSAGSTYISQVRLTRMTNPDKALVIHDDGNNLTSTSVTSYTSPTNMKVEGTITLALRIVIGNPGDSILIGGIMLMLE